MANIIKYAALFKDRHYFPSYVQDCIFDGLAKGYDPMDSMTFKTEAIEKFLKWKYEGFDCVHIYMSGLVAATVAIINAAYASELPIKLYHYSFMQDKWLPQTVDFCATLGYNNNLTEREVRDLAYEVEIKRELTKNEYMNMIGYVRIYKDLLLKYKDEPTLPPWQELRNELYKQYRDVRYNILDLMQDHLYPVRSREFKGETFNERLKRYIIKDRERATSSGFNRSTQDYDSTPAGERKAPRPFYKGSTYKRKSNYRGFR